METLEKRESIRQSYRDGRTGGEAIKQAMLAMSPQERRLQEMQVAQLLINSDGLEENFHQGTWHTVGERPLCFIRADIERGAASE